MTRPGGLRGVDLPVWFDTRMKMTGSILIAAAMLLLAGCSDDTTTDDQSTQACEGFSQSQRELADSLRDGKLDLSVQEVEAKRSAAVDSMDSAGLSTSNADIKDRVTDLVESIPANTTDLITSKSTAEAFNQHSESVARACESAGKWIIVRKIPIVEYMGP